MALQSVPLGFNSHHVLVADLYLASTKYGDGEKRKAFFDSLLDKVGHLPGVIDAGLNDCIPFGENYDLETLIVGGQPVTDVSDYLDGSPDCIFRLFSALGIPC